MRIHHLSPEVDMDPSDHRQISKNGSSSEPSQADRPSLDEGGEEKEGASEVKDYFYNYFSLGLDLLIDGHTHLCKKAIVHGNFPGHSEFDRYVKCPWSLQVPTFGKVKGGKAKSSTSDNPSIKELTGDSKVCY